MLVKCRKVTSRYGMDVMIPGRCNPSGAVLGDEVSFKVLERPYGGRPVAIGVIVRSHVDVSAEGAKLQEGAPPLDSRGVEKAKGSHLEEQSHISAMKHAGQLVIARASCRTVRGSLPLDQ